MFEFTYRERGNAPHVYRIQAAGGLLIIQKDDQPQRAYKCVLDYEHTYKIQKTQIKAQGGAAGLLEHFRQCVLQDFAVKCLTVDPIERILAYTREATR